MSDATSDAQREHIKRMVEHLFEGLFAQEMTGPDEAGKSGANYAFERALAREAERKARPKRRTATKKAET